MKRNQNSRQMRQITLQRSSKSLINNDYSCTQFNQLWITLTALLAGIAVLVFLTSFAFADYIMTLKNGRKVHVETYSEKDGVIIFSSYGGEVSIATKDVESILPAVEGIASAPTPDIGEVPPAEPSASRREVVPGQAPQMDAKTGSPADPGQQALSPEEIKEAKRAEEEKQYRAKVKEITARIKAARDQFALANRRPPGPQPSILESQAAINARTADLNSRLKDGLRNPANASNRGDVRLEQPSPFTGAPPTVIDLKPGVPSKTVQPPLAPYSPKEKKLSEMRAKILALEKERDRLIQEMRNKNFNTASMFLE